MRRWPKRSRLNVSLTLAALLILAACGTLRPTVATRPGPALPTPSACVAFPRLSYDRLKDTVPTIGEIKSYDAARDVLCGAGR